MMLWLLLLLQDAPSLTRGPYLQSVTPTSITVCWQTETEVEGVVEFGEKEAFDLTARGPLGRVHAVELRDLKPGTVYSYRVGRIAGRFRTAPDAEAKITFAFYGDGRSNPKVHQRVTEAIAKRQPDLVVHSGDLVENGLIADQWADFFRTAAPMLRQAPFYSALGNHDRSAALYFDTFVYPGNERYYSFDYGPAHFVVLDSNLPHRTDEKQLSWLKKDLAETKLSWKFAIFHHPFYSTSKADSRIQECQAMAKAWEEIFVQGGLTATLAGHNHNYQRAEKNGIVHLTSGGGGAPLYPVGKEFPETKFQVAAYHYVLFTIEGKRLSAEAVDLDGKVLERFSRAP